MTLLAIVSAAILVAGTAAAGLVPGGPAALSMMAADCYAELDVVALESATLWESRRRPVVSCIDGTGCDQDGRADRRCTFSLRTCINQGNVAQCVPPTRLESFAAVAKVRGVEQRTDFPAQPLDGSTCGSFVDLVVPIGKSRRSGVGSVRIKAKVPEGASPPRKDVDRVRVECLRSSRTPRCPANEAGGPNRLTFTTEAIGSDLDLGWTGDGHGFAFVPNTSFGVCLSECDATTDRTCTATGPTGLDTINGELFGPPVPLLTANVPLCVVHRFAEPLTGTADLGTGDVIVRMQLHADVFFTEATEVCPRCSNGRCSSGENVARPCTVDGTTVVPHGFGNRTYDLSRDCPPHGTPVRTLDLLLDPLTTGSSPVLSGPRPCPGGGGAPPRPNACSAACGSPCEGSACVSMAPDPSDPGAMSCLDAKGGLSQYCCNDDPTRACFPLDPGGTLVRRGRADAPQPLVPDPAFPKTATGTLAAVACAGSAGNAFIDLSFGLPGPAALVIPTRQHWAIDAPE